jgi:hypothetical protein
MNSLVLRLAPLVAGAGAIWLAYRYFSSSASADRQGATDKKLKKAWDGGTKQGDRGEVGKPDVGPGQDSSSRGHSRASKANATLEESIQPTGEVNGTSKASEREAQRPGKRW